MPKTSDGKKFPYTKEGMKQAKANQERLNKKKKTMGKTKTGGSSY
jgi:hypothetical protein|tara:strand:- start:335 stop:469 length:135 start_codon:yes stop_codon:yes gene_type:complete